MNVPIWLVVPMVICTVTVGALLLFVLLWLVQDWLERRTWAKLDKKREAVLMANHLEAAYHDLWTASSQTPPEPQEDVIDRLFDDTESTYCVFEPKGTTTMSKTTATVASLVAALQVAAKENGVPASFVSKFLADNGVGVTEKHTVTITASGDTFEEVRDRAVSDVTTYGPGYPESGFPVTSAKGVRYEHTVETVVNV